MPAKSYPHTRPFARRSRRGAVGLSLIEVVMALFILLMMTLMVAAVLPITTRMTRSSNTYASALAICQRKIDQLQEAGWGKLDTTSLLALGIIDSTAPVISGDVATYTFTNNNNPTPGAPNPADKSYDNLGDFFPGTGANAPTGTIRVQTMEGGTVNISDYNQPVMRRVTVTVSWQEPVGPRQTFSMTALISQVSMD
jgi:hypothetical protein